MDIGKIEKNNFLLQNDQFFSKGVEIFCEEGSYIYKLHIVTPGIPSKFTYHNCIGFLQLCKSLKKAKTLELRITLWHVGYM